jgi:cell division protein ZapA (FtsZ GTPase activity inhibitor)
MGEGRAEIEVFGQRITVRGPGSPDYIRELAAHLNGIIQTVQTETRVQDPTRLSVLAGLHLVDELFQLRDRERGVMSRLETLGTRLDAALGSTA